MQTKSSWLSTIVTGGISVAIITAIVFAITYGIDRALTLSGI